MNWDSQSKSAWSAQVLKDLKGKPLESIRFEIEPGLILDPIYTAEEIESLPPIQWGRHRSHWRMVERWIIRSNDDIRSINEDILESLARGMNVIELDITNCIQCPVESLLAGVIPELIHLRFYCNPEQQKTIESHFDAYAVRSGIDKENLSYELRFGRTEDLVLKRPEDASISSALCVLLTQIKDLKSGSDSPSWDRLLIKVEMGDDIMLNAGLVRTLKLLIHALADELESKLNTYPTIQAVVKTNVYEQDIESLIERTSKAFASVMSDVDEIYIDPSWTTDMQLTPADSRRVVRNIHWLLRSESMLGDSIDPLHGSYWMETFTRELFERTYEKFKTGGGC